MIQTSKLLKLQSLIFHKAMHLVLSEYESGFRVGLLSCWKNKHWEMICLLPVSNNWKRHSPVGVRKMTPLKNTSFGYVVHLTYRYNFEEVRVKSIIKMTDLTASGLNKHSYCLRLIEKTLLEKKEKRKVGYLALSAARITHPCIEKNDSI